MPTQNHSYVPIDFIYFMSVLAVFVEGTILQAVVLNASLADIAVNLSFLALTVVALFVCKRLRVPIIRAFQNVHSLVWSGALFTIGALFVNRISTSSISIASITMAAGLLPLLYHERGKRYRGFAVTVGYALLVAAIIFVFRPFMETLLLFCALLITLLASVMENWFNLKKGLNMALICITGLASVLFIAFCFAVEYRSIEPVFLETDEAYLTIIRGVIEGASLFRGNPDSRTGFPYGATGFFVSDLLDTSRFLVAFLANQHGIAIALLATVPLLIFVISAVLFVKRSTGIACYLKLLPISLFLLITIVFLAENAGIVIVQNSIGTFLFSGSFADNALYLILAFFSFCPMDGNAFR